MFTYWLLLVLVLATTILVNAERFKRSPILTDDVAQVNQFAYAVAIVSHEKGYICSGGIIDKRFILSAAHCFVNNMNNEFETETYMIYAGTTNYVTALGERNSRVVFVKKIFIPKGYHFLTRRADIAVVELAEDLVLDNYHFQKLNLPLKCRHMTVGERAVTAAFGLCEPNVSLNGTREVVTFNADGNLRYANIEIVDTAECPGVRPYANFEIENYHLLGKMIKNSTKIFGMCYGDSGSSLVYRAYTAAGTINTVFGVFIDAFDAVCDGRTLPAVFTKVSSFLPFIDNAMSGKIKDDMRVRDIEHERVMGIILN